MIGKSAWALTDRLSEHPRLDLSSAFIGGVACSSPSPFSLAHSVYHGVLDRYDLFPPSLADDAFVATSADVPRDPFARGFPHHSCYVGDLVF